MIIDFEELGMSHDWNENDPTKPGYIKNRPFYTGDPVETVLVEESTVPFSLDKSEGLYTAVFRSTFEAAVGEVYKVSWDGTVYECACVEVPVGTAIGNLSLGSGIGADTGEPFVMSIGNGHRSIVIMTEDTSASHTFSISGFVSEVVKIDEKYLPKTVGFITYMSANDTYSSDLTYNELYEILLGGGQVILSVPANNKYEYLTRWATVKSGRIDLAFAGESGYTVSLFPDGTIWTTPLS